MVVGYSKKYWTKQKEYAWLIPARVPPVPVENTTALTVPPTKTQIEKEAD